MTNQLDLVDSKICLRYLEHGCPFLSIGRFEKWNDRKEKYIDMFTTLSTATTHLDKPLLSPAIFFLHFLTKLRIVSQVS
jgi:hypothetical protein